MKQMNAAYLNGKINIREVSEVVTDKSVWSELSKNPSYREFTKNLSPGFVSDAILSAFSRVIEGKM
jgi:hypothetical protein